MSRVPCMDNSRAGWPFVLMGKWISAGKNHLCMATSTPILRFWLWIHAVARVFLGKLWQLGELPAVSCYTGQGPVRGSEGTSLRCCVDDAEPIDHR